MHKLMYVYKENKCYWICCSQISTENYSAHTKSTHTLFHTSNFTTDIPTAPLKSDY